MGTSHPPIPVEDIIFTKEIEANSRILNNGQICPIIGLGTAYNFFTNNNMKNGFNNNIFFNLEKEKDSTRVGSCRRIEVKDGLPFTLTFKVKILGRAECTF